MPEVPNYEKHRKCIESLVNKGDITDMAFKSNNIYNGVLENLNKENGAKYLKQIETEFPEVTFDEIRAYINANDKYGGALKTIFTTSNLKLLYCSPSSIRYIYHALIVLKYMKETTCTRIVELGGGYGGLFLAINHFAGTTPIHEYHLVELPEAGQLMTKYLNTHAAAIRIPWKVTTSTEELLPLSLQDTSDRNRFFISNYCWTAIDETTQREYRQLLLPSCSHGFIAWQTCFGYAIKQADALLEKNTINVVEESPQSGPAHAKNYHVYF